MPSRRHATALLLSLPLAVSAGALRGATPTSAAGFALSGASVNALASFSGRIWAGTDGGLYSLSPGSSAGWTAVGGPLGGREVNALAVAGSWLVAGTQDGAVRTSDGGTWVSAGLTGERVASLSSSGSTLLAGTGHDTPADGAVQRSDDAGGTWTAAPVAPSLVGLPGNTVQAVLVPTAGSPAWAGTAGGGALRSSDGHSGWLGSTGMKSSWVTAFWRNPSSGGLLAGSDDGLYAWNGTSWVEASFPQTDPWVQALATGPDGHALAGTYDGAVFAQGAGGGWTSRATGLPSVLSLLAVSGGGLMVGTFDGVTCVGCPANLAAASSPGPGHGKPAASLPPPGSRAGASAGSGQTPGPTTAPAIASGNTPGVLRALAGGTAGNGSGSSGGGVGRWLIAGGLVALSVLLLAVGIVRTRRTRQPED